jgi:hypothetical protein
MWLLRLSLVSVSTPAMGLFFISWGYKTHAQSKSQVHVPVHMTTDWSNRRMVYSTPSSLPLAWRLQAKPRYLQQWAWRKAPATQTQPSQ